MHPFQRSATAGSTGFWSLLDTFITNSAFREFMWMAWNQPWWEDLHPRNQQMLQSGASLPPQEIPFTSTWLSYSSLHPKHQESQRLYFLSAKVCLLPGTEKLQGTKPILNTSGRKTKVVLIKEIVLTKRYFVPFRSLSGLLFIMPRVHAKCECFRNIAP